MLQLEPLKHLTTDLSCTLNRLGPTLTYIL